MVGVQSCSRCECSDVTRRDWLRDHGAGKNAVVYDDPDVRLDAVALEDLLKADVYAEAVNTILNTYNVTDDRIDSADVPATDRSNWLGTWLEDHGLKRNQVQKPSVCQEAVSLAVDDDGERRPIVATEHKAGLKRLHKVFVKRLETAVRPLGAGAS